MPASPRKLISVITPCFNEQANIRECRDAVARVFAEHLPDYDYEHLFCDNASSDGTIACLRKLAADDPCVKVIFNARNFGPFRSTFNGLLNTAGDAVVVLLAADLQDPPEVMVDFVRTWEQGYEVVYGIRANRQEGWLLRTTRRLYYRLAGLLANIHLPPDVGEFQLVDRVVVDALRQFDDYYPYIRGMIAACGFRVQGVPYTWRSRQRGISKNRLYHLVDQALNGLISFSNLPMRLCMLLGLGLSLASAAFAIYTLVTVHVFHGAAASGISTPMIAQFLFFGVMMFFLGVMGEYLSAIHFQVRKRPLVIERGRLNFHPRPGLRVDVPCEASEEYGPEPNLTHLPGARYNSRRFR
ncbi:MAG TPA: glycosyltransferase family 2 protein [Pirellulales bacterium]